MLSGNKIPPFKLKRVRYVVVDHCSMYADDDDERGMKPSDKTHQQKIAAIKQLNSMIDSETVCMVVFRQRKVLGDPSQPALYVPVIKNNAAGTLIWFTTRGRNGYQIQVDAKADQLERFFPDGHIVDLEKNGEEKWNGFSLREIFSSYEKRVNGWLNPEQAKIEQKQDRNNQHQLNITKQFGQGAWDVLKEIEKTTNVSIIDKIEKLKVAMAELPDVAFISTQKQAIRNAYAALRTTAQKELPHNEYARKILYWIDRLGYILDGVLGAGIGVAIGTAIAPGVGTIAGAITGASVLPGIKFFSKWKPKDWTLLDNIDTLGAIIDRDAEIKKLKPN